MEKSWGKYGPKASSRPLLYFGKQLKTALHANSSFKNNVF